MGIVELIPPIVHTRLTLRHHPPTLTSYPASQVNHNEAPTATRQLGCFRCDLGMEETVSERCISASVHAYTLRLQRCALAPMADVAICYKALSFLLYYCNQIYILLGLMC